MSDSGIILKNVGVHRGERWILKDVNLSIPAGRCAAILGPNGSGKSTIARIFSGYIWPTVGDVHVGGHRFGEVDLNGLRKSIRLVQSAGPYDVDPELTAREVVLTGLFGTISLYDKTTDEQAGRAEEMLSNVGLSGFAQKRYAVLSSGERVRALIARALISPASLLILDEPTAGLDLIGREQVLAAVHSLRNRSKNPPTTIFITHHIEELGDWIDHVVLMSDGAIAASGKLDEVLQSTILSRVYSCGLRVERDGGRYYVRVEHDAWQKILK
jgi:iron complex transport system ATP-binding protein